MKVKLDYFRTAGKWYSSSEYQSSLVGLHEIWQEVSTMSHEGHLPGLVEGCSGFIVLVDVPDHPHRHPHLVIP